MLPPNRPNALSRRSLLQGIAAFSTTMLVSGCGGGMSIASSASGSSSSAASQPLTDPQPTPAGPITQAALNVSSAGSAGLGAGFAGLSYEKGALAGPVFTPSNTDLIALFELLGPGVLRIGGGSVDQFVWTPGGPGRTWGQVAPSDVADLAAFVKAAGWQCIYGINLGGAATGATTPALAAAEVAYAAEQFGSALLGIEIGNECDGYGADGSYFAGNWSLAQFETLWEQFRTAILDATPGVGITGPASGSNVSSWTVPFGQQMTRNRISLLTQHYYRGDGESTNATAANLISPDSRLAGYLTALNAGAGSVGVPFRMGECNSYYSGGAPGVSNAYASSLWVLDFLFNCALGGAAGVNLHGGGNAVYTPIADNNGAVEEARPIFYGMMLFTLAGQGQLHPASVSAGQLNVTAYAVRAASGGLNLVIVNKDPEQNLQLTASLPQQASSATLSLMTQLSSGADGPSLAATSGVTIQGAGITPDAGFNPATPYNLSTDGSTLSFYVPALSAVLVQTQP